MSLSPVLHDTQEGLHERTNALHEPSSWALALMLLPCLSLACWHSVQGWLTRAAAARMLRFWKSSPNRILLLKAPAGRATRAQAAGGHAAARRHARGGRRAAGRAAGGRQGAGGARHARGPWPQRRRQGARPAPRAAPLRRSETRAKTGACQDARWLRPGMCGCRLWTRAVSCFASPRQVMKRRAQPGRKRAMLPEASAHAQLGTAQGRLGALVGVGGRARRPGLPSPAALSP